MRSSSSSIPDPILVEEDLSLGVDLTFRPSSAGPDPRRVSRYQSDAKQKHSNMTT